MAQSFKKSTIREYFESIVIAVILALFIRTFVVQAFKIPTGSMENNLLIGDHLLVNKFVFGPSASALEKAVMPLGTITRGDVVVFKYPEEPERDFIKRIIGLPGETVEGVKGHVEICSAPQVGCHVLKEPYLAQQGSMTDFAPVRVPQGQYFMMGDNRAVSDDSRYWGTLPRANIIGEAFATYWPLDRLRTL